MMSFPSIGIFDLAAPACAFVDRELFRFLPPQFRIALWGTLVGMLSMTVYWLSSPREKLLRLKTEMHAAQRLMLAYDGDFAGLLPLVRRSLGLSLLQIALTIGPALGASIPGMCLVSFLSLSYSYGLPQPGALVQAHVAPADAAIDWIPHSASRAGQSDWQFRWPRPTDQLHITSSTGIVVATLPLPHPDPVVRKFEWWNVFFANPSGYIPQNAPVSSVEFGLPQNEFLSFGPAWLRGWEAIFLTFATLSALSLHRFLGVK